MNKKIINIESIGVILVGVLVSALYIHLNKKLGEINSKRHVLEGKLTSWEMSFQNNIRLDFLLNEIWDETLEKMPGLSAFCCADTESDGLSVVFIIDADACWD